MSRIYKVYDGRAMYDISVATCLDVCDTPNEAIESAKSRGDAAVYSYLNGPNGLTDESFVFATNRTKKEERLCNQPIN